MNIVNFLFILILFKIIYNNYLLTQPHRKRNQQSMSSDKINLSSNLEQKQISIPSISSQSYSKSGSSGVQSQINTSIKQASIYQQKKQSHLMNSLLGQSSQHKEYYDNILLHSDRSLVHPSFVQSDKQHLKKIQSEVLSSQPFQIQTSVDIKQITKVIQQINEQKLENSFSTIKTLTNDQNSKQTKQQTIFFRQQYLIKQVKFFSTQDNYYALFGAFSTNKQQSSHKKSQMLDNVKISKQFFQTKDSSAKGPLYRIFIDLSYTDITKYYIDFFNKKWPEILYINFTSCGLTDLIWQYFLNTHYNYNNLQKIILDKNNLSDLDQIKLLKFNNLKKVKFNETLLMSQNSSEQNKKTFKSYLLKPQEQLDQINIQPFYYSQDYYRLLDGQDNIQEVKSQISQNSILNMIQLLQINPKQTKFIPTKQESIIDNKNNIILNIFISQKEQDRLRIQNNIIQKFRLDQKKSSNKLEKQTQQLYISIKSVRKLKQILIKIKTNSPRSLNNINLFIDGPKQFSYQFLSYQKLVRNLVNLDLEKLKRKMKKPLKINQKKRDTNTLSVINEDNNQIDEVNEKDSQKVSKQEGQQLSDEQILNADSKNQVQKQ